MNRLYGMLAAVTVCFVAFMALALSGRNAGGESGEDSGDETVRGSGGKLLARVPGRELRLAVDTEPQTLDPISVVDTVSDGVSEKIYNRLLRLKLNEKGELKPGDDLAESHTITPDGKLYTFKLRKGVLFHNGREMKAADVVYSLKRLLSPLSKRADLLEPFVKGAPEYVKANGDRLMHDDPNLGIRALDDYTVQIELANPFGPFEQHLCTVSCAVVPKEAAEDPVNHLSRVPVGTGPFKLAKEDWYANRQLVLRRFDQYFGGKPKMEAIKFLIYKEHNLHLKLFMAGQLDAATIPQGHVKEAEADVGPENWIKYQNVRTNYIGFGMPSGKWKNKADLSPYGTNKLLRQAMSFAIDRENLCKNVLEGRAVPAIGVLPPGLPGCKESRPPMKKDLAKASELMKQAGYPNGEGLPPVTMLCRNDPDTKVISQAIQQDLKSAGFPVQLQFREWNRFLEETENEPAPMFLLGWVADYPDPDNFLYVLFNSKQWGSEGNTTFYSNPEVDRLTEEARHVTDFGERTKLYEKAEDIILDEMPWVCTYHPLNEVLIRKEVKGIRENKTMLDTGTEFPMVEFRDVYVATTAADEKATALDEKIGQGVSISGVASMAKFGPAGPVLLTSDGVIYIGGLSAWPDGFIEKAVAVGGVLTEAFDLPVYEKKEGAPPQEGVPIPPGGDKHAASRRLIVKLKKMELLEK
ncbi:MAG TPA: ABC transporter substrate-binding protein [Planctomycetota bacterium]|nr:ABC transporter substrate-binding protein [Planctomycetota bacterium]